MSEQASVEQVTSTIDPAIKAELDREMSISLNGGIVPAPVEATPASVETAENTIPSDPFGIFKEKFGYETPEVAIQDIESLRALRASPPQAELKFENEQSKLVVEALQAGKFNEVYQVLDQQLRIDRLVGAEMTPEIAADIVKLGMQIKNKELTAAEIDFKFKKQFGLPAKPGIMPAEYQEEYNEKMAAWEADKADKEMELMIEAKLAKPDLENSKTKLVFPTINRPQDQEFLEWQKSVQENDRLAAETAQAYKAFTPKSIETKLHFVDKENKIDFEFQFEPDPESFNASQAMVADLDNFWKSFINSDGTPDRRGFLEAVYFAKNKNTILMEAIRQTKNATIKAGLPDNSTGGLIRQMPQNQEPNELDTMMRQSLKGYGGF